MQTISKLSCCAILFSLSQLSLANNLHTTNESDLITIPPHSRSVVINAKHAQECAEMGGVDISDKHEMKIGHGVTDSLACEITDKKRYELYLAAKHQNNLKQTCDTFLHDDKKPESGNYTFCVNAHGNGSFYGYPIETSSSFNINNNSNSYKLSVSISNFAVCSAYTLIHMDKIENKSLEFKTYCSKASSGSDFGILKHTGNASNYNRTERNVVDTNYIQVDYPYDQSTAYLSSRRNLGQSLNNNMCTMASSDIGNPINTTTGNKFQQEVDYIGRGAYPLKMVRYYNSQNESGHWTHSYSAHIEVTAYANHAPKYSVIHDDGREEAFFESNGVMQTILSGFGSLKRTDFGYSYINQYNEQFEFDKSGNLIKTIKDGLWHVVNHVSKLETVVSDNFGQSITIIDNGYFEPEQVKTSGGKTINYKYDSMHRLVEMSKNGKTRKYHYEDSRFPRALTGITDENGVRYVIWNYDDKGLAISSEYAGKVNQYKVLSYLSTYTNFIDPLGETHNISRQNIDGIGMVNRLPNSSNNDMHYVFNNSGNITSKSNSFYSYNYNYNDKGQETTRTIAKGRAEQAIISTTWNDRFNKPKTVTYPDKVITYTYDNDGNVTSKTIKSLN